MNNSEDQKVNFDTEKSDIWKEGYTAGFLTPGPFTIIGIFGLGYLALKK